MKKVLLSMGAALTLLNAAVVIADDTRPHDNRAVLLIDVRDIKNRTKAQVDLSGLADRLEDVMSDSGIYRVLTKKSLERSIQEKERAHRPQGRAQAVPCPNPPRRRRTLPFARGNP